MLRVLQANLANGFRGGEQQTLLLAEALAELGIASSLLLSHGSGIPARMKKPLPCTHVRRNLPLRLVRNCDLVHAQDAKAVPWAYWNYRRTGTPYLITRHLPFAPGRNPLTRAAYANAAAIICISNSVRDACSGQNQRKLTVIPNMATPMQPNPAELEKLRRRYANHTIVGHIGALNNRHKGQEFFIAAARALAPTHPRLRFLLIGDGPDEAALRRSAASLPNVEFIPFPPNIANYLALMDLFAFPSRYEGLGSILLDAMQFALPIAASNVSGVRDVITDGETGLLFPDADPTALAHAITRITDTPALAHRLSQNAAKHAANHTPAQIAQRHHTLYQRILRPEWQ